MFRPPLALIFTCCLLSLAAATLNPTLIPTRMKSYFYVNPDNYLSYELYQTRHGIIASSIEDVNQTATYTSQHVLIDITSGDAKPILADIVKKCDLVNPTFPYLHYHVQTDSLVYFCFANNSLLVIDQSHYTVQTVIPLNISGIWPVVKLTTDDMSIAVLLMGELFATAPQASTLVKINMQVRQVTAEIWLNKGFGIGEVVVAYASNKKAAYIATNRIESDNLATTIYSIATIGSSYQITPLTSFSASMSPIKIVTKLFCFEKYLAANNGQDLYFINQKGAITKVPQLNHKSITRDQSGLFHLAMTTQYGRNDIYIQTGAESVFKYTVIENTIHFKEIGGYGGIQIAYGNQNSGDLMFTTDFIGVVFSIIDLETLQPIYTTISGYTDLMLTDATYGVVQAHDYNDYHVYIFDLQNDTLLAAIPIDQFYYYTREQHLISFFNNTGSDSCNLTHIDLITAKTWSSLKISGSSLICDLLITDLRLTERGTPEFVVPVLQDFMIYTESYGSIDFQTGSSAWSSDKQALAFDFDTLTFAFLDSDPDTNTTNVTLYAYDFKSEKVNYQSSNLIENFSAENGFYPISKTSTAALANNTLAIINNTDQSAAIYQFSADWNSASSFQDSFGYTYIVLTKDDILFQRGSAPGLFSRGKFISLPGLTNDSVRAKADSPNSYWIGDELYTSVGIVRFYDTGSESNQEKTLISI